MDFFILYIVTILSNLRSNLEDISTLTFYLLCATSFWHVALLLFTSHSVKTEEPVLTPNRSPAFRFQESKRITTRGLYILAPIFVLSYSLHTLLPSSKGALIIAGGYSLQELVKNPRTQRLFVKSADVATQWLNSQLGVPPSTLVLPAPPPPAHAETSAPASPPAPTAANTAPVLPLPPSTFGTPPSYSSSLGAPSPSK